MAVALRQFPRSISGELNHAVRRSAAYIGLFAQQLRQLGDIRRDPPGQLYLLFVLGRRWWSWTDIPPRVFLSCVRNLFEFRLVLAINGFVIFLLFFTARRFVVFKMQPRCWHLSGNDPGRQQHNYVAWMVLRSMCPSLRRSPGLIIHHDGLVSSSGSLAIFRRNPARLIHRGSRKASIEAHSHDQGARPR